MKFLWRLSFEFPYLNGLQTGLQCFRNSEFLLHFSITYNWKYGKTNLQVKLASPEQTHPHLRWQGCHAGASPRSSGDERRSPLSRSLCSKTLWCCWEMGQVHLLEVTVTGCSAGGVLYGREWACRTWLGRLFCPLVFACAAFLLCKPI